MNRALILAGLVVLALAWAGPLPRMVAHSFAAHMVLHVTVIAVGVPLLAAGLAPRLASRPGPGLPVAASLLDLIVVWGWHAPALHEASRQSPAVLAVEQVSFATVALLVWLVALARPRGHGGEAALGGAAALFFTSMHMTLLGALIGLAPRGLFHAHGHHDPVADQQLGGAIMLVVGGAVYLAGALVLMARVLRDRRPA